MKSWTIFKSHIIPLAKMRLFLRPFMRSLIVPQYALECHKMPSKTPPSRIKNPQCIAPYHRLYKYTLFARVTQLPKEENGYGK